MTSALLVGDQRIRALATTARQFFGNRGADQEWLSALDELCGGLATLVSGGPHADEASRSASRLKSTARSAGAWRLVTLADRLEAALGGRESPQALEALIGDLERAIHETGSAAHGLWNAA